MTDFDREVAWFRLWTFIVWPKCFESSPGKKTDLFVFTKIFILSRHNDGWYGITFKIMFYLASAKQLSLSSMTIRES